MVLQKAGVIDPNKYLETLGISTDSRQRTLSSFTDSELETAFKFKTLKSSHPSDEVDNVAVEQVHEVRLNVLLDFWCLVFGVWCVFCSG